MTRFAGPEWPGHPAGPLPAPVSTPPAPVPAPPAPIPAGRAYAEILLVFGLFFAASIISAGETLASHVAPPAGSWASFIPVAVQELSTAAVAVLVVVLLAARRGITRRSLGAGLPRRADGKAALGRITRMAAVALLALAVGGAITALLATGRLPQPAHPTGAYLLYAVAASLYSGVVEEIVVLAFVVTTLRQAGRPVPEILVVAVLLRCSYHIYYGPGVVGIAVWALVFAWLFLRIGSVVPLIVLHFLWDAVQFLAQKWPPVAAIAELAGVALLVAGFISWLVALSSRRDARRPGPPGPPGPLPPGAGLPPGGDAGPVT